MRWVNCRGWAAWYVTRLVNVKVPAALRASKLSYDPPSNSRPTRIACARPMLKSMLSATSSTCEEPWLFTPAPPPLKVSMTLMDGPA